MFAIDSSQDILDEQSARWASTRADDRAAEWTDKWADEWANKWADEQADEWADASCRDDGGSLTELFFSDQIPDIIRAKQICAGCALIDPCLSGALDRREPWGVWGGQLFLNGKILAQKRRRGRPPKNPAPGIQLTA